MNKITLLLLFTLIFFQKNTLAQTEIKAFHRCGQTFITWAENPMAAQYRIYRHSQPITAANLAAATRIATLGPGSGRHITEEWRNNGFYNSVQERFVLHDLGQQLPQGTGLCVWTTQPGEPTTAFYAVARVQNGTEVLDFQAGVNSLSSPLAEAVAEPCPVKVWQSTDGLSAVFTQFVDIKYWNITYDGFAYNYAVMKPQGYDPSKKYPLCFDLHCWGCRYNPTLSGGAPFGLPVILVYPDDAGKTWWFGFSKTHQYREQWPDANWGLPPVDDAAMSGPIVNYTEQRLLRILDDLEKVGGYSYDPNRIYFWGNSMGGTGVIQVSMRYPDLVAAGYASVPVTNFEVSHWNYEGAALWGPHWMDLPVEIGGKRAQHLQKFNGQSVWDWQNAQLQMRLRQGDEMAYLCTAHGDEDIYVEWWNQGAPWYEQMQDSMRRGGSGWTQNKGGHDWMGFKGTGLNWGWLNNQGEQWLFPRNSSFPAFTRFSGNSWTNHNLNIQFAAPWNFGFPGAITDTPGEWSVLLKLADHPQFFSTFNKPFDSAWVDVTPRRLQNFKPETGKTYRWIWSEVVSGATLAQGTFKPDAFGLLTVPQILVKNTPRRLRIVPENAPPPNCDPPSGISVGDPGESSVQIVWQANPDAIGYLLSIGQVGLPGEVTFFSETASFQLENLQSCTAYFFKIQTICANGLTSSATPNASFSTDCPPPPACPSPGSLSVESITQTSAEFTWTAVPGAEGYNFWYRLAGAPDSVLLFSKNAGIALQNLPPCSDFQVNLQSVCPNGQLSADVFSIPFSTQCPPQPCLPSSSFTVLDVGETSAVFQWSAVAGASGYRFWYRAAGASDTTFVFSPSPELTLQNLPPCTFFDIGIHTLCPDGQVSASLPNLSFSTDCPPQPCLPSSSFTVLDVGETSAVFQWSAVAGASGYRFWYRAAGASDTTFVFSPSPELTLQNLPPCTFFDIGVHTLCPDGQLSVSLPNLSFSTDCPPQPCHQVTNLVLLDTSFFTADLAWSPVDSATAYDLEYRPLGIPDWSGASSTGTDFTLTALDDCREYEARVRALCPQSQGEWSNVLVFKTACTVGVGVAAGFSRGLKIHPNPACERAYIRLDAGVFDENFRLEIFDTAGKKWRSDKPQPAGAYFLEIDIKHLPSGVYQVVLVFENGESSVGRFVKFE